VSVCCSLADPGYSPVIKSADRAVWDVLKPLQMLPDPFIGAAIEKELSSVSCVDKEFLFCFKVYVMVFCELRKFVQYLSRDREMAVNDELRTNLQEINKQNI
jgi:hypothetical protein